MLGWLSKLVNAGFGQFVSSTVTSRGSAWELARVRAYQGVFTVSAFEGSGWQ